MICPPDHAHAETWTCRVTHKCSCLPCKKKAADAAIERRKSRAYGRYRPPVDAAVTRRRVQELLRRMSFGEIAAASGVSIGQVYRLARKAPKRVSADIAEAIAGVRVGAVRRTVPVYLVQRRLHALMALGWPVSWIAREAGMSESNLRSVRDGDRSRVMRQSAFARLTAAYERLSMTHPVGETAQEVAAIRRTRERAAREGWAPPMAWEDIDSPKERPKGMAA